MKHPRLRRALSLTGILLGAQGCAGNKLTPSIESSAEEASYAVGYPKLLERERQELVADKTRAREQKYLSERAKTKEERRTSEERAAEIDKSKAALDGAVRNAEAESRELEQTIRQAQGDYGAAYDALIERIRARATLASAAAK